jgi:hypothetical protein
VIRNLAAPYGTSVSVCSGASELTGLPGKGPAEFSSMTHCESRLPLILSRTGGFFTSNGVAPTAWATTSASHLPSSTA